MKHKNTLIIILLVLLTNFHLCYAENSHDVGHVKNFRILIDFDVIEEKHIKAKFDDKGNEVIANDFVTRREVLEILCNIRLGKDNLDSWPTKNSDWFETFGYYFVDIENDTYDSDLVLNSCIEGFLRGVIDDNGRRYANLDEKVTTKETLIFLLRLIMSPGYDYEVLQYTLGENWWYTYAETNHLINGNIEIGKDYIRPLNYSLEDCDQLIQRLDFLILVKRILHTPTVNTGSWEPTRYYFEIIYYRKLGSI